MLTLKHILIAMAVVLFASAASVVAYDLWFAFPSRRHLDIAEQIAEGPFRWRTSVALIVVAWTPLLLALGIAAGAD
jgi:hypothetical protein